MGFSAFLNIPLPPDQAQSYRRVQQRHRAKCTWKHPLFSQLFIPTLLVYCSHLTCQLSTSSCYGMKCLLFGSKCRSQKSLCFRVPNSCSIALLITLFPTSLLCSRKKPFVGFLRYSAPSLHHNPVKRLHKVDQHLRTGVPLFLLLHTLGSELNAGFLLQPFINYQIWFIILVITIPLQSRLSNLSLASSEIWFIIDHRCSYHASAGLLSD